MRLSSEGILVLGRYTSGGEHPFGLRPPACPPSVDLDHAGILAQYRGIDGVTWPEIEAANFRVGDECLADVSRKDQVKAYFDFLSSFYSVDMLYCQIYDEVPFLVSLPGGLGFLGYDYGCLTPDYQGGCGSFSVLFNEVIFGSHERLRPYGEALNEHLLSPSLELLKGLHAERCRLLESGEADLETAYLDEPAQTIAVFDLRENDRSCWFELC